MNIKPLEVSIILCTYNPRSDMFVRVLNAVASQDLAGIRGAECIIVDNNSRDPIADQEYVRDVLRRWPWIRVVREGKQGLMNARLRGFHESAGELLIFLDDDNEVCETYVQEACHIARSRSDVGVWGPGRIEVDFFEGAPKWVRERHLSTFQARSMPGEQYARDSEWQPFYPFGTGMCIRLALMQKYVASVESGRLSAMGRNGGDLGGGEDVQMVLLSVMNGYQAGSSSRLALTHLIPRSRTSAAYLRQLHYAVFRVGPSVEIELFPNRRIKFCRDKVGAIRGTARLARHLFRAISQYGFTGIRVSAAQQLGSMEGAYLALGERSPIWTRVWRMLLGV